MSSRPRFTFVFTSDRYKLDWEEGVLANLPDMDITVVAGTTNSDDDLIALGKDADALMISSREAVSRRVIEGLPNCKVISRYAVGLDHIDTDAATDHGIVVTHVPDYCTDEVADHALALILALNRRILEQDQDLRNDSWLIHTHHTRQILRGPMPALREQTLGLVGLGRIGTAVIRRARPFGMRILVADPYADPAAIRAEGGEPVDLDTLLQQSDIVSLHCPLTNETRGMIGEREFGLMKPTATFVNTARGPIVHLAAVTAALQSGTIAAAGLDVFETEPLPKSSPLYAMPNVILTPHSAYYSESSIVRSRHETLWEAIKVLRGERPRTIVNPAVLEKVSLRG